MYYDQKPSEIEMSISITTEARESDEDNTESSSDTAQSDTEIVLMISQEIEGIRPKTTRAGTWYGMATISLTQPKVSY